MSRSNSRSRLTTCAPYLVALGLLTSLPANAVTIEEFDALSSERKKEVSPKIVEFVFNKKFKDAPKADQTCIIELFRADPSGSIPGNQMISDALQTARADDPKKHTVEMIVFAVLRNECDTAYKKERFLRQSDAAKKALDAEIERLDDEVERLEAERARMLRCTKELPDGRKVFLKSDPGRPPYFVFPDGSPVPTHLAPTIRESTTRLATDICGK